MHVEWKHIEWLSSISSTKMFYSLSEKHQFRFKWHNLQQHENVMMQKKNETSPNSDKEESYLRGMTKK